MEDYTNFVSVDVALAELDKQLPRSSKPYTTVRSSSAGAGMIFESKCMT